MYVLPVPISPQMMTDFSLLSASTAAAMTLAWAGIALRTAQLISGSVCVSGSNNGRSSVRTFSPSTGANCSMYSVRSDRDSTRSTLITMLLETKKA